MQYYKTLGGALSAFFEEKGLCDDDGKSIKSIEPAMTEAEFIESKKVFVKGKVAKIIEQLPNTIKKAQGI